MSSGSYSHRRPGSASTQRRDSGTSSSGPHPPRPARRRGNFREAAMQESQKFDFRPRTARGRLTRDKVATHLKLTESMSESGEEGSLLERQVYRPLSARSGSRDQRGSVDSEGKRRRHSLRLSSAPAMRQQLRVGSARTETNRPPSGATKRKVKRSSTWSQSAYTMEDILADLAVLEERLDNPRRTELKSSARLQYEQAVAAQEEKAEAARQRRALRIRARSLQQEQRQTQKMKMRASTSSTAALDETQLDLSADTVDTRTNDFDEYVYRGEEGEEEEDEVSDLSSSDDDDDEDNEDGDQQRRRRTTTSSSTRMSLSSKGNRTPRTALTGTSRSGVSLVSTPGSVKEIMAHSMRRAPPPGYRVMVDRHRERRGGDEDDDGETVVSEFSEDGNEKEKYFGLRQSVVDNERMITLGATDDAGRRFLTEAQVDEQTGQLNARKTRYQDLDRQDLAVVLQWFHALSRMQYLNEGQFVRAISKVYSAPDRLYRHLFAKVDPDAEGRITYDQFISYLLQENTMEDKFNSSTRSYKVRKETPVAMFSHKNMVDDIVILPEFNLYATCARDGLVKVWDQRTCELKHTLYPMTRQKDILGAGTVDKGIKHEKVGGGTVSMALGGVVDTDGGVGGSGMGGDAGAGVGSSSSGAAGGMASDNEMPSAGSSRASSVVGLSLDDEYEEDEEMLLMEEFGMSSDVYSVSSLRSGGATTTATGTESTGSPSGRSRASGSRSLGRASSRSTTGSTGGGSSRGGGGGGGSSSSGGGNTLNMGTQILPAVQRMLEANQVTPVELMRDGGVKSTRVVSGQGGVQGTLSWPVSMEYLKSYGRLVVITLDRLVVIYNVRQDMAIHKQFRLSNPPMCSTVGSMRGRNVLIVGDTTGMCTAINLGTYKVEAKYKFHVDNVTQVRFVPGVGLITAGMDGRLTVSDPERWDVGRSLNGHTKGVYCFGYSDMARLIASGGQDRDILLWTPFAKEPTSRLKAHKTTVVGIEFNDELYQMFSMSADKVIHVWDIRNWSIVQTVVDQIDHSPENQLSCMAWDAKLGRLVTAGSRLRVWPMEVAANESGNVNLPAHSGPLVGLHYSKQFDCLVSVAVDGNVRVWAVAGSENQFQHEFSAGSDVNIVASRLDHRQRRLVTSDSDGTVTVWNFSNGERLYEINARRHKFAKEVTQLWYMDHKAKRPLVGIGRDKRIAMWPELSFGRNSAPRYLHGHESNVTCMTCVHDLVIAGAHDGTVLMWRRVTGQVRQVQPVPAPQSVGESSSSSSSSSHVKLPPVELLIGLPRHEASLQFSGGAFHAFGTVSGKVMASYVVRLPETPQAWVLDPSESLLLTGNSQGVLRLWSVYQLVHGHKHAHFGSHEVVPLHSWRGHKACVATMTFYTTKSCFVTGDINGHVHMWSINARYVCSLRQNSHVHSPHATITHSMELPSDDPFLHAREQRAKRRRVLEGANSSSSSSSSSGRRSGKHGSSSSGRGDDNGDDDEEETQEERDAMLVKLLRDVLPVKDKRWARLNERVTEALLAMENEESHEWVLESESESEDEDEEEEDEHVNVAARNGLDKLRGALRFVNKAQGMRLDKLQARADAIERGESVDDEEDEEEDDDEDDEVENQNHRGFRKQSSISGKRGAKSGKQQQQQNKKNKQRSTTLRIDQWTVLRSAQAKEDGFAQPRPVRLKVRRLGDDLDL